MKCDICHQDVDYERVPPWVEDFLAMCDPPRAIETICDSCHMRAIRKTKEALTPRVRARRGELGRTARSIKKRLESIKRTIAALDWDEAQHLYQDLGEMAEAAQSHRDETTAECYMALQSRVLARITNRLVHPELKEGRVIEPVTEESMCQMWAREMVQWETL